MLETMFLNLDEGRGASLVVICWTISAIALSFVIARVFTRVKLKSAAGKDDLAIVLAMVSFLYLNKHAHIISNVQNLERLPS